MQEYKVPEVLISFWQMINSHLFWSTNEYTEKVVTQELGDMLINKHQDNCVKVCLTDIWVTKRKSDMETRQCK